MHVLKTAMVDEMWGNPIGGGGNFSGVELSEFILAPQDIMDSILKE